MTREIKDRIEGQILHLMLSIPKAQTREGTARAVLKALRPYLRKPAAHKLLSGHVSALLKLRKAVLHYNRNEIHIRKEMADCPGAPFQLTKDEWSNFTKLRYHGLAVKSDRRGYWLLSKRGGQFLRGELSIPETVITFANRVFAHEGPLVGIDHFKPLIPEFDKMSYGKTKAADIPPRPLFV